MGLQVFFSRRGKQAGGLVARKIARWAEHTKHPSAPWGTPGRTYACRVSAVGSVSAARSASSPLGAPSPPLFVPQFEFRCALAAFCYPSAGTFP